MGFPMERIPPTGLRRLLEEQEKAYKAKISALEKRIKALEDEVKKLQVPWPQWPFHAISVEEIHGFFPSIFHGKIRCEEWGGLIFLWKNMKNINPPHKNIFFMY